MILSILGKKLGQVQGFLENGNRIPMTRIDVAGNTVTQIKTTEKDGYQSVQLGFGINKKADKPTLGHAKKAGLSTTPRTFREARTVKIDDITLGSTINAEEVLGAGDIVDVIGVSKGKGYAGVVKRHHFKGGPKTHGQSDRHRAPGSIGQSTTPGRVYKGKRMAGRMGHEQVTIKNLEVIEYNDGIVLIKGLVPGPINTIVTITKKGENKKHIGLYKEPVVEEEIPTETVVEEIGPSVEEQEAQRVEVEKAMDKEEKAEKALDQGVVNSSVAESDSVEDDKAEATSDVATNEDTVSESESKEDKKPSLAESMMTDEEKAKK